MDEGIGEAGVAEGDGGGALEQVEIDGGFAAGEEDGNDEAVFFGEAADEVDFARNVEGGEDGAEGGDLIGRAEGFKRRGDGEAGGRAGFDGGVGGGARGVDEEEDADGEQEDEGAEEEAGVEVEVAGGGVKRFGHGVDYGRTRTWRT